MTYRKYSADITDYWVYHKRLPKLRIQIEFKLMRHNYGGKVSPRYVWDWRLIYDGKPRNP